MCSFSTSVGYDESFLHAVADRLITEELGVASKLPSITPMKSLVFLDRYRMHGR